MKGRDRRKRAKAKREALAAASVNVPDRAPGGHHSGGPTTPPFAGRFGQTEAMPARPASPRNPSGGSTGRV